MGVDPLSLGIIALVGAGIAGGSAMANSGKKKEEGGSAAPAAPAAPTTGDAKDTAAQKILARKKTGTILTNPYGVKEPANVKAPTLLGSGQGNQTLG